MNNMINKKRIYGEYYTPSNIFREYILPEIKNDIYNYIWTDLFAGEGNLILPILKIIPENKRIDFFKKQIFLFDVQENAINKAIGNAVKYGIPVEIAQKNICKRDTLKDYPSFLLNLDLPVFHITNPPYLYIGNISKHTEMKHYLNYFKDENKGYQDLYQLAIINDLKHKIKKMIYIIPTNFIFGDSNSNKIRKDIFPFYNINKAIIFEKYIFNNTKINVIICFFIRKKEIKIEDIKFEGTKISNQNQIKKRNYILLVNNKYRAGSEFNDFITKFKAKNPINFECYLLTDYLEKNSGEYKLSAIDANDYNNGKYNIMQIAVNQKLYEKIKSNILFIRTIDSSTPENKIGKIGLYIIKNIYNVDSIITKNKYRTHPIPIFFNYNSNNPKLSIDEQILLKEYFNLIFNYFREITDSEFLTTYKNSINNYTRKYLGLKQARALIQTFPILDLSSHQKEYFSNLVLFEKNPKKILDFLH